MEENTFRVLGENESVSIKEEIGIPEAGDNKKGNANLEPATKRQRWALFCLTKEDWREKSITKQEAKELIDAYTKDKGIPNMRAKTIINRAIMQGKINRQRIANVEGADGFCMINIHYDSPINRRFINLCKKSGYIKTKRSTQYAEDKELLHKDEVYGGDSVYVQHGNLPQKEAFADAFIGELAKEKIEGIKLASTKK